jgi:hypothetical protein
MTAVTSERKGVAHELMFISSYYCVQFCQVPQRVFQTAREPGTCTASYPNTQRLLDLASFESVPE